MVRKRAVKSTESGQTPSRPKRNKATHNKLEKVGNPSSEVNGKPRKLCARLFELGAELI